MFRVPLRFTLHKPLLKRRVTDLLNLRGLAQVRAVGKQGRRSLCFHKYLSRRGSSESIPYCCMLGCQTTMRHLFQAAADPLQRMGATDSWNFIFLRKEDSE